MEKFKVWIKLCDQTNDRKRCYWIIKQKHMFWEFLYKAKHKADRKLESHKIMIWLQEEENIESAEKDKTNL